MKTFNCLFFVIISSLIVFSCGGKALAPDAPKMLIQPIVEQTELKGGLIIVDGSIMLLATNTEQTKSLVLLPANDSIKDIAHCAYEGRIDNGCRISLNPWIMFRGNYIRKDPNRSIFKFSEVKILDDGSTCSMIAEE